MTLGGDGGPTNTGHIMSDEEKQKHHDAMVGRKFTEEHKEKIREANKGKHNYLKYTNHSGPRKPLSEEHKQKIRESHKG